VYKSKIEIKKKKKKKKKKNCNNSESKRENLCDLAYDLRPHDKAQKIILCSIA